MPAPVTTTLFCSDNLPILRDYVTDASVDLVYLDPPFNSNRTYNVLFRQESGAGERSGSPPSEDTWHWNRRRCGPTNCWRTRRPTCRR